MAKKDEDDRVREGLVTYDVYAAMPDDGQRYEILDGVLELMSPGPMTVHQTLSRELFLLLQSCSHDYEIYYAPIDVILSQINVLQPDILMIHRSRLEIVKAHGIEGAPDLVVEILSPSSRKRDLVVKANIYARYGVPEYWIVDPEGKTLEQYELGGERFELRGVYSSGDRISPKHIPCAIFEVGELFRGLDLFSRSEKDYRGREKP